MDSNQSEDPISVNSDELNDMRNKLKEQIGNRSTIRRLSGIQELNESPETNFATTNYANKLQPRSPPHEVEDDVDDVEETDDGPYEQHYIEDNSNDVDQPEDMEDADGDKPEIPKRGPPSRYLKAKQDYERAVEKQIQMQSMMKKKEAPTQLKKGKFANVGNVKPGAKPLLKSAQIANAGKAKPDQSSTSTSASKAKFDTEKRTARSMSEIKTPRVEATADDLRPLSEASTRVPSQTSSQEDDTPDNEDIDDEGQSVRQSHSVTRIPSKYISKMELNKARGDRQPGTVPSRYAAHMKDEAKERSLKNVKTLGELRRVKESQGLDVENQKATLLQLRQMRTEQKLKEKDDLKQKALTGKKDTEIKKIMENNELTPFQKLLRVKHMSVSNTRRIKVAAMQN
jgi:hypothetical protein